MFFTINSFPGWLSSVSFKYKPGYRPVMNSSALIGGKFNLKKNPPA